MSRNYLALDVGDRRIGVAMASEAAHMPWPVETIDRQTDDALKRLTQLVKDHDVFLVVVGLPRDMSGNETAQTRSVQAFIDELHTALPDIEINTQDEAVTSIVAEDRLKSMGKAYEKADIDKEAATIILEDWLNSQKDLES